MPTEKSKRRNSVKALIRSLLIARKRMRKGAIEDAIREMRGSYGETVARRLREMTEDGEVVKDTDDGRLCYELATKFSVTFTPPTPEVAQP